MLSETANYGNEHYQKYLRWNMMAPRSISYAEWLEIRLTACEVEIANLKAAQHSVQADDGYCHCPITKTEAVMAGSLCPQCLRHRR